MITLALGVMLAVLFLCMIIMLNMLASIRQEIQFMAGCILTLTEGKKVFDGEKVGTETGS